MSLKLTDALLRLKYFLKMQQLSAMSERTDNKRVQKQGVRGLLPRAKMKKPKVTTKHSAG